MKVSLRDFQLKPTDYLKSLPVQLTRYGKVVAIVSEPSVNTSQESVNTPEESVNILEKKAQELVEERARATRPLGKCEGDYCKNPAIGRFAWKYFDNSSGESFGKEQSLCEYHRNKCKNEMEKVEGEFKQL